MKEKAGVPRSTRGTLTASYLFAETHLPQSGPAEGQPIQNGQRRICSSLPPGGARHGSCWLAIPTSSAPVLAELGEWDTAFCEVTREMLAYLNSPAIKCHTFSLPQKWSPNQFLSEPHSRNWKKQDPILFTKSLNFPIFSCSQDARGVNRRCLLACTEDEHLLDM